MKTSALIVALSLCSVPSNALKKGTGEAASCAAEDMAVRAQLQNKLADVCIDMCKKLGAYPEKCTCPKYVDTEDKTPGVVTWEELLSYMGNLEVWGRDMGLAWTKQLSALQFTKKVSGTAGAVTVSESCLSQDLKHRALVQNKLVDVCVDMCKEVGEYPERCKCPKYVDTTDKTPDVVTWPELLTYMDEVEKLGDTSIKQWQATAR
jgi:hypothetical protein